MTKLAKRGLGCQNQWDHDLINANKEVEEILETNPQSLTIGLRSIRCMIIRQVFLIIRKTILGMPEQMVGIMIGVRVGTPEDQQQLYNPNRHL